MSYQVTACWDEDGGWVLTCPAVPGAVSQCARLEQAPGDMAEALTLMEAREVRPDEITVSWSVPGDLGAVAGYAAELRARAEEVEAQAARETRRAVRGLRNVGISYRDIGRMTGVSYQRAQQIGRELEGEDATARVAADHRG
jgi:predicted RNase H-like HicB family nuclease